jgi:FKBP-type peptidyl-prolyl cis-trans isomerase
MKKLNKGEQIAAFAGIAFLAYLFFSGPLLNFFSSPTPMTENTQNNINLTQSDSRPTTGFAVENEVVGTGEIAQPGDRVSAHYVGTLPDGRVFDSSRDRGTPITFMLGVGQVIRGWDEGIQGMREGGKRTLIIAPDYGYGAQAVGTIPANSTLIFEVELVGVEKSQ